MAENSGIQWTDHTFNPWTGCTKVSPGCANCYAEGWAKRSGIVQWGPGKPRRRTSESLWKQVLRWNRDAMPIGPIPSFATCPCGFSGHIDPHDNRCPICDRSDSSIRYRRPRVFCASLADWLDDEVPIHWLADLLALIQATPNLDWLLLTKRPGNFFTRMLAVSDRWEDAEAGTGNLELFDWLENHWMDGSPPSNVWIGTTCEDQQRADERLPELLKIPAKVRFLSCEPLLRPLHLGGHSIFGVYGDPGPPIHWVICGGESGSKARPMEIEWARSLKRQCDESGVHFFMKQLGGIKAHRGEMEDFPEDLRIRSFPVEHYGPR